MADNLLLKPVAYYRGPFGSKFGIPRQSSLAPDIEGRIVFTEEFRVREALRGLEGFSRLWLIWGFSEVHQEGWSPMVKPPKLGGNKRMGVFATRSPYRPNPIGLSSVKLIGIENGELIVSGADVLDGTPIYDIKPYLSFSDSHPDAQNGFAEETKDRTLEIVFYPGIDQVLTRCCPRDTLVQEISYILAQDPRPAYQDDPEREYKMDYAGYRITFTVKDAIVDVKKIEKM